ncbi:CapA family protein [Egicoccus halophilus]|uniref:Capsule synthesis protein CapA domain-containing protein n=1 Tax=Egicoccus halophilus TaxID=1670830 RepID=A0A8J3AGZ3_9ACTN|nr:CapA family protein [Egicoccus halophilus]GGI08875.1 hypothetical protein GCM10011354_31270 [Egicoccus halophilus]
MRVRAPLVGVALLAGACASTPADPEVVAAADEATTEPAPSAPLTLAFVGDIHFADQLGGIAATDPGAVLAGVRAAWADADLVIGNLETAVTEGGTPEPKQFTFRTPATSLAALSSAGIDAVSLANNHAGDYGADGLRDTLAAADGSGLAFVGIGADERQAAGPVWFERHGWDVAVLAATDVLDSFAQETWVAGDGRTGIASVKEPYTDHFVEQVATTAAEADLTLVYLHWGREKDTCPTDRQRELAQRLAQAGADVVVGTHAHRVQGGGRSPDGALVHYGLGNFVFDTPPGEGEHAGVYVVEVALDGTTIDRWLPVRLDGGLPVLLEGQQAAAGAERYAAAVACTDLLSRP